MKKQFHHLQLITLYVFCMLPVLVWGQLEHKPFLDDFRGTASVTHNGISLVPSFSLGEPAAIFDVKMTKGKFSFEPDMRTMVLFILVSVQGNSKATFFVADWGASCIEF